MEAEAEGEEAPTATTTTEVQDDVDEVDRGLGRYGGDGDDWLERCSAPQERRALGLSLERWAMEGTP